MIRFLAILFQVAALAALAAGPPLENFCSPFTGTNCVIVWNAPTNQLPQSTKIWKVVPAQYSSATISNLLQLAELTAKDKKRPTQPDGVFAGKDVLIYANKNESRQLTIAPSQGIIGLGKIGGVVAEIPKEKPVGVPDPRTAFRLTLALLERIGIDIESSHLVTNSTGKVYAGYGQAEVIGKDKASGKIVTNIVEREIHLPRQIDGIPVWGPVGVFAKFGNEGRLADLDIRLRAITPDKIIPIPDDLGFIKRIKSGKTLIRDDQASQKYNKLIVTDVSLYYWENSGSEPQSHIYPFAILEAKTDQQGENSNVQLFVPLANE